MRLRDPRATAGPACGHPPKCLSRTASCSLGDPQARCSAALLSPLGVIHLTFCNTAYSLEATRDSLSIPLPLGCTRPECTWRAIKRGGGHVRHWMSQGFSGVSEFCQPRSTAAGGEGACSPGLDRGLRSADSERIGRGSDLWGVSTHRLGRAPHPPPTAWPSSHSVSCLAPSSRLLSPHHHPRSTQWAVGCGRWAE